jgi:hypothetical protein
MILLLLALLLHRPTSPHVAPPHPTVTAAHVSAPAVRVPAQKVYRPWTPPPRRRPAPAPVVPPVDPAAVLDLDDIPVVPSPPDTCPAGSLSYLGDGGVWLCDPSR